MSWDSKTAAGPRRRQNSSAAAAPGGGRSRGLSLRGPKSTPGGLATTTTTTTTPVVKIDPKSTHTADPFLQDFLNPAFDPAEYLNAVLPSLQQGSSSSSSRPTPTTRLPPTPQSSTTSTTPVLPLADLSAEAQALLTQLNAHTTRLAATLGQLTDDILRSGSRLAYEVELLRGEALGLAETLASEGPLRADLERFAPASITTSTSQARRASLGSTTTTGIPPTTPATAAILGEDQQRQHPPTTPAATTTQEPDDQAAAAAAATDEPPYISHLRTLTLVRARLDAVIKTFGDAMEFVFPPSEVSVSSGFLSVSAPDVVLRSASASSEGQHVSTEDKGQQVLKKIRDEVAGLLLLPPHKGGGGSSYDDKIKGVEDATRRVEQIKDLSAVWRGTAEEKGRQRFVESLVRMVEDRHRELVREMEARRDKDVLGRQQQDEGARRDQQQAGPSSSSTSGDNASSSAAAAAAEPRGPLGGYGFMNQWQKIRGGL